MLWQILALSAVVVSVAGHGRVLEPPSRASMWRNGFPTPANYDDDGLNCGGFHRQYATNDGKCGICGDPWDEAEPRRHEIGGLYGSGRVVAEYEAGQVITATIEISAYHRGFWYFKICPDATTNDQACFDRYPVELEQGGTQYYPSKAGLYTVNYRLPEDLVCEHCVLQWRYVAGNNWGYCTNGTSGLGCGNQETFGACTDISIKGPRSAEPEAAPIPLAYTSDADKDLIDLLRRFIPKPMPRPNKKKANGNKKKNHRKPRKKKTKPPNRKKVTFWQF